MTVHDSRGNRIEEGALVAYNLSGQVAIGEVVKDQPPFKVRLGHSCAGLSKGHISNVRHAYSIIVLTPADMP